MFGVGAMFKERLIDYSERVLNGEVIACVKHKQACKRFLRDCEREGSNVFPYVWREEEVEKIVAWFKLLRHSKGVLSGKTIDITKNDWQLFNNANLYGWYHRDTGYRRFTKGYIQVARKNAKSQNMAGIGLYECAYVSTKNNEVSEVYSAGTKRDQSKIIFDEAKLMLKGSPLRDFFDLRRNEIIHKKSGSFITPLSKEDSEKGDGTNPQCFLIDEYHQHETAEFYDLADSGMKARAEPLLLIITTAGRNLNCPCYQQEYRYASEILLGIVENDCYYVMICELDKEDDFSDERAWAKANPIVMSYPEGVKGLRESYEIARDVPEKMASFVTKNLDAWIQQKEDGYMNMEKWEACTREFDLQEFKGSECVLGIDLSAKIDLTSVGFVFPLRNGEFWVLSHSFIPEDTLSEKMRTDRVPYDLWAREGFITVTPGAVVDYDYIKRFIMDFEEDSGCVVREICVDPWNATQFMLDMEREGYTVVEIGQTIRNLASATKDFRDRVFAGKIFHMDDPVLNFAIGNAVVKMDHNENIMLDKAKSRERIDPIASIITGFSRAIVYSGTENIFYSPNLS